MTRIFRRKAGSAVKSARRVWRRVEWDAEGRLLRAEGYLYAGPWSLATHANPSLDQAAFRARNDDGSESAATWKAAANTDWTQAVDENFRIRFLVQETAGGGENNVGLQLQYNLKGAGWNPVNGTSSVVQSAASTQFADDDNTTQQLGAGTFITPNSGMDEDNGLAGENNDIDFAGSDEVEVEYCCQILSGDVADSDTIQLRLVRGDLTVLEGYTNTPSITVSEVAPDVNIAVPLDTMSMSDQVPAVASGAAAASPADSMAMSDLAPAIASGASAAVPLDAMSISDLAPSVASGSSAAAPSDSMSMSDLAPVVQAGGSDLNIEVPLDTMSMVDRAAAVASGAALIAPLDAMSMVGQAPSVSTGVTLVIPTDVMSMVDLLPTVGTGVLMEAPADSMNMSDLPPAVASGALLAVPLDVMSMVHNTPAIAAGATIQSPLSALVMSGFAPLVSAGGEDPPEGMQRWMVLRRRKVLIL